jgi:multiple sugar transport system ATP-binding protein
MAKVKIEHLNKKYGEVDAVKDLSLTIEDGEFLVLLGPSGCGKTTTLRCIAGLETATSGNISIDDKIVNDIPPKDRNVSMVFQSYALFPHMSVFNNIAFPLKMRKVPKEEIEERVKRTASLLQISELLKRRPKELSGGQMQRVALGRSIVREPKVFLMDEPLSNLDAKLRIYMRAELKALQKRLGITTIYVTHDQVEALTMADRIAILNDGILQQLGNSDKIYNTPENVFVGSFIGSPPLNLLPCSLLEKKGKVFLESDDFLIDVSIFKDELKKGATTKGLILGFRPEKAKIQKSRVSSDDIGAKVYVTEPLGAQSLITLKLANCGELIKVIEKSAFKVNFGEKVWLNLDKNKIHIFDKKTEKAII